MDNRVSAAKRTARVANGSVSTLSDEMLRSISGISDFRAFLRDNHRSLLRAADDGAVYWSRLLHEPEIIERNFRDANGKPITARLASRIWQKVRKEKGG